jgi:hypothetical protein
MSCSVTLDTLFIDTLLSTKPTNDHLPSHQVVSDFWWGHYAPARVTLQRQGLTPKVLASLPPDQRRAAAASVAKYKPSPDKHPYFSALKKRSQQLLSSQQQQQWSPEEVKAAADAALDRLQQQQQQQGAEGIRTARAAAASLAEAEDAPRQIMMRYRRKEGVAGGGVLPVGYTVPLQGMEDVSGIAQQEAEEGEEGHLLQEGKGMQQGEQQQIEGGQEEQQEEQLEEGEKQQQEEEQHHHGNGSSSNGRSGSGGDGSEVVG